MAISEGARPSRSEQPKLRELRVGETFKPFEDLVFPNPQFTKDHPVRINFVFNGIHGELTLMRNIHYGLTPGDKDKLPLSMYSVFMLNEAEYRQLNNYAMKLTSIGEDGKEEHCYLSLGDNVSFDQLKRRSGIDKDGRVWLQNMHFQRTEGEGIFELPIYEKNIASAQARIVEKPFPMGYY